MAPRQRRAGRVVAALCGLLLAYAAFRVLAPFFAALAAAGSLAVVFEPLQARLRRRLSRTASSALLTSGVCLALALPLSLGAWYLARESLRAYPLVRQAVEGSAASPDGTPPWLPPAVRRYLGELSVRSVLLENVHELGAWSGRAARSAAASAAVLAADAAVFALSLFVFLRDGDGALELLSAAIPLPAGAKERIRRRARDMLAATVEGVFAVAVVQGALSALGFALLGVRFPVLLGGLCMALSPIPFFGSTLVWVPVAAATALSGSMGKALLLAGWFALVVGTSDNVLRPVLVGARSHLPVALVVVGVLGGIRAFGAMGAFLGPVIVALAAAVAQALLEEARDEAG